MPKWKSVLTILSAMVWCWGLVPSVSAHDGEPNPPFDPTKVQITDDLPCFSKSLANPYGHPGYNPKLCGGLLSPKIATHTTGVHGGLIWKKDSEIPKYLLWFRHPEFRAEDVVSSEVLERLIDGDLPLPLGVTDAPRNPLTGRNEGAFRDPRSNFQGAVRQSYAWGMYGASASSAMAAASRDGFTSTAASKTFRCGICPTRSHSPVRESTTSPK